MSHRERRDLDHERFKPCGRQQECQHEQNVVEPGRQDVADADRDVETGRRGEAAFVAFLVEYRRELAGRVGAVESRKRLAESRVETAFAGYAELVLRVRKNFGYEQGGGDKGRENESLDEHRRQSTQKALMQQRAPPGKDRYGQPLPRQCGSMQSVRPGRNGPYGG